MKIQEKELVNARHSIGLYSVNELCLMFDCGRAKIDNALNSRKLRFMSPNGKARFVFLKDFIEFTQQEKISN